MDLSMVWFRCSPLTLKPRVVSQSSCFPSPSQKHTLFDFLSVEVDSAKWAEPVNSWLGWAGLVPHNLPGLFCLLNRVFLNVATESFNFCFHRSEMDCYNHSRICKTCACVRAKHAKF